MPCCAVLCCAVLCVAVLCGVVLASREGGLGVDKKGPKGACDRVTNLLAWGSASATRKSALCASTSDQVAYWVGTGEDTRHASK